MNYIIIDFSEMKWMECNSNKKIIWKYYVESQLRINSVGSSESATTAPVTTAQLTARWTR